MKIRRFPLVIASLALIFLLSACAQATLEPIIIRMTATPPPAAPTEATVAETQAPATPTEAAVAETQAPPAGDTPEAAATEAPPAAQGEEVRFDWVKPLQTIEQADPIVTLVLDFDGVLAANGNEDTITITYNPAATSVQTLMDQLKQIGHEVKPPQ